MSLKVSVITPSFNQAAFLDATIRSVLAQDYADKEYIIVDGASSDGSLDIIRSHSKDLAWWISESDHGQAEAINKGMLRARGDIVAWINSDDFYLPNAISEAVRIFEESPELGLVFGDALSVDENGAPFNSLIFNDSTFRDLLGFRIICQPAVFMRRDLFIQAGMMEETFHYMLDHHLWLRIGRLAPIRHAPRLWAAARIHAAAKNNAQASGFARETSRVLAWLEENPEYSQYINSDRNYIRGGAYRLEGRYYLDGNDYASSIRYYGKALLYRPAYAMSHWRRIFYAFLGMIRLQRIAGSFIGQKKTGQRRRAQAQARRLLEEHHVDQWPGLRFDTQ